jgi:hypothetical protein
MAEFDLGSAVEAFNDTIGEVGDTEALENFKAEFIGTDLGPFADNFTVIDGKLQYDGEDFKTENVKAYNEKMEVGDVEGAMREVFPDSAFKDTAFTDMVSKLTSELSDNPSVIAKKGLADSIERGKTAQGDSASDGSDAAENKNLNDALEKRVKELEEQAKKDGTSPADTKGKFGDWVKNNAVSLLMLAGVGGGIGALIALIKDHQNKMNGCWLVNKKTGNKQKVKLLTCDSKNQIPPPLSPWGSEEPKSGATSTCKGTQASPCCDELDASNPTRICKEYQIDKKTGKNPVSPTGQILCKTCLTQCKGSSPCSSYCDCSTVANCPKDTYLTCVNVDFWGAAGDFLGDALGGLVGGFLKAFWRVAKWIILAVGIVVLAIVAWKVIEFVISETRKKKSAFGRRRPPRLK